MSEKTEKIKQLWNKAVVDYDLHMQETGHYVAQETLLNELGDEFRSPILDLATGPGFLAGKLLDKGSEVTLNDFSEKMLQSFSQKFSNNPNVTFSHQDAHIVDSDKKFTTILCCNLFYYLEDRNAAIQNWKTLLQKDGSVVLFEEYPFRRPETKEMHAHEVDLMNLIQPISPDETEAVFSKNGFKLKILKKVAIDARHDLYGFVFTDSTS